MRVLTIVMAVIAPATLIASIMGMNIALPGGVESGSLLPLGILFSIMAIVGVGMFAYFRHRGWI